MATYNELRSRITEIRKRTGRGSISPRDTFDLLEELLEKLFGVDMNAASMSVQKTYASYAAMTADNNPTGDDGRALKHGQLVAVSNDENQEENSIYRFLSPGWEKVDRLGDLSSYAKQDDLVQLAGENPIYNLYKDDQSALSLSDALLKVPEDKRLRATTLIYNDIDNGITSIQHVNGNPQNEEVWNDQINWKIQQNNSISPILFLQEKDTVENIRKAVPYRYRVKGQLIHYVYQGFPIIEEVQNNYTSDEWFTPNSNFKPASDYSVINLNNDNSANKIFTFDEAVAAIPLNLRKRNTLLSYKIDENKEPVILLNRISDPQSTGWMDRSAWVTVHHPDIRNTLYLNFAENQTETRKGVPYDLRRKGQLIQYDFEGRIYTEQIQTSNKSDEWFLRESNFVEFSGKGGASADVELKVKQEITNGVKESQKYYEKSQTNRAIIHAPLGNINEKTIQFDDIRADIVRVGLHYGTRDGDIVLPDEIYFDGQCKRDFSDVRFTDENDNPLEHTLISVVDGYDISREYDAKAINHPLPDGRLICGDYYIKSENEGVFLKDGLRKGMIQLQKYRILLCVTNDGSIFSRGYAGYGGNHNLYRMTQNPDGSYTPFSEKVVFSVADGSYVQTVVEDSKGNLYCSKYQADWHTQAWKSVNSGDTWTEVYNSTTNQHVHHIYIDDRDWIFMGMDGYRSDYATETQHRPACVLSKDYGVTWENIPIPFENRDYGVTYSGIDEQGKRYYIGNGECSILGGYTLYKSYDLVNFYPVLNTKQGVRKVVKFRSYLLAGGNAGQGNRTAQIYMSKDDGETWETIHLENWHDTLGAGDGLRFFSDSFTYPDDNVISRMICNGYGEGNYYPVTIIRDVSRAYSVCQVKTDGLKNIKVKWGYSLPFENPIKMHTPFSDSIKSHYRFDEGAGFLIEDIISKQYAEIMGSDFNWINGQSSTYEILSGYYGRGMNGLSVLDKTYAVRNVGHTFLQGITIVVWLNTKNYKMEDTNEYLIWGDPNNIHLIFSGKRMILKQGTISLVNRNTKDVFRGTDVWTCHQITINNQTHESIYKIDGGYPIITTGVKAITSTPNAKEYILGDGLRKSAPYNIADLKIYNRALSYNELIKDFLGYNVATRNEDDFEHVNY